VCEWHSMCTLYHGSCNQCITRLCWPVPPNQHLSISAAAAHLHNICARWRAAAMHLLVALSHGGVAVEGTGGSGLSISTCACIQVLLRACPGECVGVWLCTVPALYAVYPSVRSMLGQHRGWGSWQWHNLFGWCMGMQAWCGHGDAVQPAQLCSQLSVSGIRGDKVV
jgi:hypothetical protein